MEHRRQRAAQSATCYLPAVIITPVTYRHSLARVPVTTDEQPELICGMAHRVGYTGTQDHDLAIYRLKIKSVANQPTITLPGFFVIDQGIFMDYEQWKQTLNTNQYSVADS